MDREIGEITEGRGEFGLRERAQSEKPASPKGFGHVGGQQ
jgi:hypothetical protein